MPEKQNHHDLQPSNSQQLEKAGLAFLVGFTTLLCFQLLGEVSVRLINIPVPGPVIGLIMLLVCLFVRQKRGAPELGSVISASSTLLTHLSLLFVPASVGVITHLQTLSEQWQPIAVSLLAASIVTLTVTAFSLKCFIFMMKKKLPE